MYMMLGKDKLREIITTGYKKMFDKPPSSENNLLAFAMALFMINSNAASYLNQGIVDAGLIMHFLSDPPKKDVTNLDCFKLFQESLRMYEAIYQSALIDKEVQKATEALHKEMQAQG